MMNHGSNFSWKRCSHLMFDRISNRIAYSKKYMWKIRKKKKKEEGAVHKCSQPLHKALNISFTNNVLNPLNYLEKLLNIVYDFKLLKILF